MCIRDRDRAALLSALQCVDGVVLFEEDTPAELLAYLRPNILVKGGDYKKEDIVGRESVEMCIRDRYCTECKV